MASTKRKKDGVSIESYDNAHFRQSEQYAKIIQGLFDRCTAIITQAAQRGQIDPDKPFSFADYPQLRSVMEKATKDLAGKMEGVIVRGSRKEWEFATKKCDAFIASIVDTSKLTKTQLKNMRMRSLEGLAAFQERKVGGMNLSQRVWKYVGQYREQMEQALDVGLGDGRSAAQLARDVKSNLVEPDRLFRRVRDKRGNLQLSRNAAAYHPGQGVYRSSVKNAQRLTRSEINMAYRESDWQRWQSMDFVIGFEVVRSNHEPEYKCDLCERLKGKYPKSFKFVGWHPQCRCHVVPIMADYFSQEQSDDRVSRMRAALYGTEHKKKTPSGTITELPKGFQEWRKKMIDDLKSGKRSWKEPPYFVRDNFTGGDLEGDLKRPTPSRVSPQAPTHVAFDKLSRSEQNAINTRINAMYLSDDLEDACFYYGISTDYFMEMSRKVYNDKQHNWHLVDDMEQERRNLESQCDQRCTQDKQTAKDVVAQLSALMPTCRVWDASVAKSVQTFLDAYTKEIAKQNAKRWGEYMSIMGGSCQRQITAVNDAVRDAKADLATAQNDGRNAIANAKDKTKTTALDALVKESPRVGRDARTIIKEINDEIDNLEKAQNGLYATNIDELKKNGVAYNDVSKHKETLTAEKIIETIGGGDRTSGSCASVGLAYAANRGGYNVLDFRDGDSRRYFSATSHLIDIADKLGCETYKTPGFVAKSGVEWMKTTEIGKEYYLFIGRHAAIVRQVSKGKYEYLELQSAYNNGWHHLDSAVFKTRFAASGRDLFSGMIEISKLYKDESFIKMMGYINTAESDQRKGKSGTIK